MDFRPVIPQWVLLAALLSLSAPAHSEILTLQRALEIAARMDPGAARHAHLAAASRASAVAAGQLPDPVLRFGGMNFPVDTFDRDQEPMTQFQLGIQQMFPPGATRAFRQQEQDRKSNALHALHADRLLEVQQRTTLAWLERHYAERRYSLLEEESTEYKNLQQAIRFRLESGTATQADFLAVKLAHSRLRDRITEERRRIDTAISSLGRWVGWDVSGLPLGDRDQHAWLTDREWSAVQPGIRQHPRLRAAQEEVAAAASRVAQAQEAYGASWGVDLAYGARDGNNPDGSRRPDFASAMIMVSLPLFPDRRQDATLSARQSELLAAKDREREILIQLQEEQARAHAQGVGLERRLQGYADNILPQAQMQADSALRAYRSNHGSFEALLRARLALQAVRFELLDLQHERDRWRTQLAYLSGKPLAPAGRPPETAHE